MLSRLHEIMSLWCLVHFLVQDHFCYYCCSFKPYANIILYHRIIEQQVIWEFIRSYSFSLYLRKQTSKFRFMLIKLIIHILSEVYFFIKLITFRQILYFWCNAYVPSQNVSFMGVRNLFLLFVTVFPVAVQFLALKTVCSINKWLL